MPDHQREYLVSFATELNDHVARLGIAKTCATLAISRRTLEHWRYKKTPRKLLQIGILLTLNSIPTK